MIVVLTCSLIALLLLLWLWIKLTQKYRMRKAELIQREAALDELEASIKNLDKVLTEEREAKRCIDEQSIYSLDRRLAEKRVAMLHLDEQAAKKREAELKEIERIITEKRKRVDRKM